MFRRIVTHALAGCLLVHALPTPAAAAPVAAAPAAAAPAAAAPPASFALVSRGVTVTREGSENPVAEVAKSVYWGALAGFILGGAITLADDHHSAEPLRWGIVVGAFAGLGAGIWFVAHRPSPESMLELRDGHLVPNPAALAAVEPVPGGLRVRAVGVRF